MLTFHVLTDFTAAATNALHYAVSLADHVQGQVRVWHVLPRAGSPEASYFNGSGEDQAAARQRLEHLQETVGVRVPCTAAVLAGEPGPLLSSLVGAGRGHVLVVGNGNPAKPMRRARYSTALHLIRTVPQPLLVVPSTFRAGPVPRRIVLDTDRRAVRLPASADTIPSLLAQFTYSRYPLTLTSLPGDVDALLQRLMPEVMGIHVYTNDTPPGLEDVADQIRQMGLLTGVAHTVAATRHSSIEMGIRHAAARHQADLLAFVTRQRTYPGRQFFQSVSAGLLAHSSIPVLTVPEL